MMYRIKIDYYNKQKETYTPQVKEFLFWKNLDTTGEISFLGGGYNNRDLAISAINKHDFKYGKPISSKIEYINL